MDDRRHDEMRLESQAWLMDMLEKYERYRQGMRYDDGTETRGSTEQQATEQERKPAQADILGQIRRQLSENS